MNSIAISIRFIKAKPLMLLLFIILNYSLMMPIQMLSSMGKLKLLTATIGLILAAFSFYLMAGLYSCIWKTFSGQSNVLKNIIKDSNQYFSTYFLVSIILGVIGMTIVLSTIYIHMNVYYPEVDRFAYAKQLDANLVRSIPSYFIGIIFAYIMPVIYVANLRGGTVIKQSVKFIINNLSASSPVIALITMSSVIRLIISQYTVAFDYASIDYWKITSIFQVFFNAVELVIFLTAVQIFHDHYQEEKTTAYNKSLERDT